MRITNTDPNEYIASLPKEYQDEVVILDKNISSAMRKLPRTMWEGIIGGGIDQQIIGYGSTASGTTSSKATPSFIVGLAVHRNHISVYLNITEEEEQLLQQYKDKLGKVKVEKSSITFRSIADIYLDELVNLIKLVRKMTLSQSMYGKR